MQVSIREYGYSIRRGRNSGDTLLNSSLHPFFLSFALILASKGVKTFFHEVAYTDFHASLCPTQAWGLLRKLSKILSSDPEPSVLKYAEMRFNFVMIFGKYFLDDLDLGVTILSASSRRKIRTPAWCMPEL